MAGVVQFVRDWGGLDLRTRGWFGQRPIWRIAPSVCQGVIYLDADNFRGAIDPAADLRQVRASRLPVVWCTANKQLPESPSVLVDERKAGQLAARHLIDIGAPNLALFSVAGGSWAQQQRQAGFLNVATESGRSCPVYIEPRSLCRTNPRQIEQRLGEWVAGLPKPVGIGAIEDFRAAMVLRVCVDRRLMVPQQVAVVGIGNDELLCLSAQVELTSVELGMSRVGYKAAQVMASILRGARPPATPVLVSPSVVVRRKSTDVLMVKDDLVARCLNLMRTGMPDIVSVKDLLNHVNVSRKTLEKRFRCALGSTPAAEIRREQLSLASQLLIQSDMNVAAIARQCGFANSGRLAEAFGRSTGMSPSQFRKNQTSPSLRSANN
jgi:LacI family transcriptional regulator